MWSNIKFLRFSAAICALAYLSTMSLSQREDDWPTYGYSPQRTGLNPSETTIDVTNVGKLKLAWRLDTASSIVGQIIVVTQYDMTGTARKLEDQDIDDAEESELDITANEMHRKLKLAHKRKRKEYNIKNGKKMKVQVDGTCPEYKNATVGCADCQVCPDGSTCPVCISTAAPTVANQTAHKGAVKSPAAKGQCPIYKGTQPLCQECQYCPDGTLCNECTPDNPNVDANGMCIDTTKPTRSLGYVGDISGMFYAVDIHDGCIVWQQDLGAYNYPQCGDLNTYGLIGSGTFDRSINTVYMLSGTGTLYALNMRTGVPLWTASNFYDPTILISYGSLLLWNNVLYITLGSYCDLGNYRGAVLSFDIATRTVTNILNPSGPTMYGGGIWGIPGVTLGSMNPSDRLALYVNTGNCKGATTQAYLCENVIDLNENLEVIHKVTFNFDPRDADFGSSAIYFNSRQEAQTSGCKIPIVAASKKNGVFVTINADTFEVIQNFLLSDPNGQGFYTTAAWDPFTNILVMPTNAGYQNIQAGLIGFKLNATCGINMIWNTPMKGATSPTIVGAPGFRVVFTSGYYEFNVLDIRSGKILLQQAVPVYSVTSPTVTEGVVILPGFSPGALMAYNTTVSKVTQYPSLVPTLAPSHIPSRTPTRAPTPTPKPSYRPSKKGETISPTLSQSPTIAPTPEPTIKVNAEVDLASLISYYYTHDTFMSAIITGVIVGVCCCLLIIGLYCFKIRQDRQYQLQNMNDDASDADSLKWEDSGVGARSSLFGTANPHKRY